MNSATSEIARGFRRKRVFRADIGHLGVPRVERVMVFSFSRIYRAMLPMAMLVSTGAGCGDLQLNQSRFEPFFVAQTSWNSAYAPGLVILSEFPGLVDVENPRFVSSNPSVATASVVPADSSFALDGVPAIRLNTGGPGRADIALFDGASPVRSESIEVSLPGSWRFDFTYQNQFAPRDAALSATESVEILEFGQVLGVVEFSRSGRFSVDDIVVASGKVDSVLDLLLQVEGVLIVGAGADAFRFNQLSSGDLVSLVAGGITSFVGLQLPNGESLFSSGLDTVFDTEVEELEVVVSQTSEDRRADIAVYGRTESGRVLGLAPIVTHDGVSLRPFATGFFAPTLSWLFELPSDARTGTVEARWRDLIKTVGIEPPVEPPVEPPPDCLGSQNEQVYMGLEYTANDGIEHSGLDAASAIALDCLQAPNSPASDGCALEFAASIGEGIPLFTLRTCVELCLTNTIEASTGESLTPDCFECLGNMVWQTVGICRPECITGVGTAECAQCIDDRSRVWVCFSPA